MIRADIESLLSRLQSTDNLTVAEQNLLRDCEIALGQTSAKPQTVAAAWKRAAKAVLS